MKHCENVFLIISDSLRYDTAQNEMPTLSRLAKNGIDVQRCYAPGAGTASSMPGIMQSRLPIEHGGYGLDLPPEPSTLAEQLSDSDVNTLGLHSNVYTSDDAGFSRGFDTFADLGDFGTTDIGVENKDSKNEASKISRGWRSQARKVVDKIGIRELAEQAIEPLKRRGYIEADPRADGSDLFDATVHWLENQEGSTFTWLQLMDTHIPYLPPEEYRPDHFTWKRMYDLWQALISHPAKLNDEEIKELYELYCGEAAYVDDLLRQFVNDLKSRGIWDSTALIFTSDHGELFNDRTVPGDAPMKHPNYLCEEISHVPFIIAGGGVEEKTINHPASGVDIAPSVTDILGVNPDQDWRGVPIDSEDHYGRNEVVAAVSHTRGSGVAFDPDALHIAVRNSEREFLWWHSRDTEEYYRNTDEGIVEIIEGGDEWEDLKTTALKASALLEDVKDAGDVGGEVSHRLANLGYVEK